MRLLCALVAAVVVVVRSGRRADPPVELDRRHRLRRRPTRSPSAGSALLLGAGVLFLGRSRVDADAEAIRFRNVVLTHELPWYAVRAVASTGSRLGDACGCATTTRSRCSPSRRSTGEHAVRAVEGLRALLAAAEARRPDAAAAAVPDPRE